MSYLIKALAEKNTCCNCGSKDRVRPFLIVPKEQGGKEVSSNVALICRRCDMVRKTEAGYETEDKLFVGLTVSKPIGEWVINRGKVGDAVRDVIHKFLEATEVYDDLTLYQAEEESIRLNVWLDKEEYAKFKNKVDGINLKIKDVMTGLLTIKKDSLGE